MRSKILTGEIEVDRGCDLSKLVLGLDFVEASVGLYDVIQLEDDHVGPAGSFCNLHEGSVVFGNCGLTSEPENIWLRPSGKLTLKDEAIAVILLYTQAQGSAR